MRSLLLLAPLAAALLVSCATAAAAPARVQKAADDHVTLVVGGIERELKDGEVIPVGGDLTATVRLRPLAGVPYSRVLVVSLMRGAVPVTDASVRASAEMRYMDHGSFQALAQPSGDGHYVAALQFAMAGEWKLGLAVRTAMEAGEIVLDLDDYD